MKVILRLIHFIIYFYHFVTKKLKFKYEKAKTALRYYLLLALYFTDERILMAYGAKTKKTSSHTAIIVNHFNNTRLEVIKIGEVAAQMILTGTLCVTIFDLEGHLHEQKSTIGHAIKRRLDIAYNRNKGSAQILDSKDLDKVIKLTVQKEEKGDSSNIAINFICTEDNKINLLKVIKERGQEAKSGEKAKADKKEKFLKIESYLHQNLACYEQVEDNKNVSKNPQMIMVFNSRRKILELRGFPMLMKEIAEIFECGNLLEYRTIDFVRNLERYSQIEQRWGI